MILLFVGGWRRGGVTDKKQKRIGRKNFAHRWDQLLGHFYTCEKKRAPSPELRARFFSLETSPIRPKKRALRSGLGGSCLYHTKFLKNFVDSPSSKKIGLRSRVNQKVQSR